MQLVATRFNKVTVAKLQIILLMIIIMHHRGTEPGYVEHVEGSRRSRIERASSQVL